MPTRPPSLGVYVHFPYCVKKCPYCDFASYVVDRIPHEGYADAVLAELRRRLDGGAWAEREVVSVYFGGGTPSLWAPGAFARVLAGIREALPVRADAEITVEANPGAAESGTLAELREAGANRVSFGTQSFRAEALSALGRWHSVDDSYAAAENARGAGFDNVSLDLIYAVPGQTPEAAADDVRRLVSTGPQHVSAYCLTLDAKVRMYRDVQAGRVVLPDEDASDAIERSVQAVLSGAGYERYEISNHALPGRRAVHNSLYWTGTEYLALGAAAHGFLRVEDGTGVRYANHASAERYLALAGAGEDPTARSERLDAETLLAERMFSGLRLTDGVDLDEVSAWSGLDAAARYAGVLGRLERQGLVERAGPRVRPTARGLRFHEDVAVRFV